MIQPLGRILMEGPVTAPEDLMELAELGELVYPGGGKEIVQNSLRGRR